MMIHVMRFLTFVFAFTALVGMCGLDSEGTYAPLIMSIVGAIGALACYVFYWRYIYG